MRLPGGIDLPGSASSVSTAYLSQDPHRCKFDWGARGARLAAERGDIVILVDTLCFSTTVSNAVSRGVVVYPCGDGDDRTEVAMRVGGEASVHRRDASTRGGYSLSPASFDEAVAGTIVALWSPNGANCSRLAVSAPLVFLGAFVNARYVCSAVCEIVKARRLAVTVVACGERIPLGNGQFGEMRMAIEDYLAAGCILSRLSEDRSPEATICVSAYKSNESHIAQLIRESVSGREAKQGGFENDVLFSIRTDVLDAVPVLRNGAFVDFYGKSGAIG